MPICLSSVPVFAMAYGEGCAGNDLDVRDVRKNRTREESQRVGWIVEINPGTSVRSPPQLASRPIVIASIDAEFTEEPDLTAYRHQVLDRTVGDAAVLEGDDSPETVAHQH